MTPSVSPCTDDLAVAIAEPATEVPDAVAVSATVSVDEAAAIIEPNVAASDATSPDAKGQEKGKKARKTGARRCATEVQGERQAQALKGAL